MKKQNGITLIALVITIIVMLILVGVSVTVSLNGGLFTTAQNAKAKTQLESEKEQLLEMTIGALDNQGKVVYEKLNEIITEDGKFEMAEGTEAEQGAYTSESGTLFVVGERATISEAIKVLGGDVNGDGVVDGTDDMLLGRYTSGWAASDYADAIYLFEAGDLNGDGVVDGTDDMLLGRYTSGWAASDYADAINLNKVLIIVK